MFGMKKILYLFGAVILLTCCAQKPYVIVQVADAQLGFTAAVEAGRNGGVYTGDLSYETGFLKKAVAQINEIGPDAVVFTGDQIHVSGDKDQWDTFARVISEINPDIRVFHLPGNHDVIIKGSQVDCAPFTDRYGQDRFLHCEKGVRLVGINTNLIKYGDPREEEQLEWLRQSLVKEDKSEVSLVFGHHPFFLEDIDEPDSYFPIDSSKRRLYFDMFSQTGLDVVYAGHKHDTCHSEYAGIPMRTTTSSAYQLGASKPSIRVITVIDGTVTDSLLEL